ncbi:MAG: hypothetical protein LBV47_08685 [Bacteroidales bacterium]|jgi:hypothetical protein|nr:hypothetical protein [Bacteroidales bacterium]
MIVLSESWDLTNVRMIVLSESWDLTNVRMIVLSESWDLTIVRTIVKKPAAKTGAHLLILRGLSFSYLLV